MKAAYFLPLKKASRIRIQDQIFAPPGYPLNPEPHLAFGRSPPTPVRLSNSGFPTAHPHLETGLSAQKIRAFSPRNLRESHVPVSHHRTREERITRQARPQLAYQSVEKRDLLRCASSFVIAGYRLYASFLRIRAPCISSFLNSLSEMLFFNGLLRGRTASASRRAHRKEHGPPPPRTRGPSMGSTIHRPSSDRSPFGRRRSGATHPQSSCPE